METFCSIINVFTATLVNWIKTWISFMYFFVFAFFLLTPNFEMLVYVQIVSPEE